MPLDADPEGRRGLDANSDRVEPECTDESGSSAPSPSVAVGRGDLLLTRSCAISAASSAAERCARSTASLFSFRTFPASRCESEDLDDPCDRPLLWRLDRDRGLPLSEDSELPWLVVLPLLRMVFIKYCVRMVCILTCLAALQCSKHINTRQKTTGT